MMIPLCCYFLLYFFWAKSIYEFVNDRERVRVRVRVRVRMCVVVVVVVIIIMIGDIYIYNIGSVERDRQKKEVGGGGGDVRVHSDNYPAYKYFYYCVFFLGINLCFVFCVLCVYCG